MEQFAPLLLLLFFWVFIGIPIALAKKSANQKKAVRPPVRKAPEENPSPAAPRPAEPERLTPLTSSLREPDHDDSVFTGSLGAVTGEGYDPCHEEQLRSMEKVCKPDSGLHDTAPAATGGLPLGWTGNDMVRGIVMSEILNRKRK